MGLRSALRAFVVELLRVPAARPPRDLYGDTPRAPSPGGFAQVELHPPRARTRWELASDAAWGHVMGQHKFFGNGRAPQDNGGKCRCGWVGDLAQYTQHLTDVMTAARPDVAKRIAAAVEAMQQSEAPQHSSTQT